MAIITKECCTCKEVKPISEYGLDKQKKDGYRPQCKACKRASANANRPDWKPRTPEQNRRYAATRSAIQHAPVETQVCRVCQIEKPAADFHRHAVAKNGLRHKCKSCVAKQIRAYKDANPTYAARNGRNYYSRKRGVNMRHLDPEWFDLVHQEAEDVRLRRQGLTGTAWHLDHVEALAVGGLHIPENWQVIPATSNIQKGVKQVGRYFGGVN